MLFPRAPISTSIALVSALAVLSRAQQLQLNYYSDNYCNDYESSLEYYWAGYDVGGENNCLNYNYGASVNIANCFDGDFCTCFFFYGQDCTGGYTSIQDAGYDPYTQSEWNCLLNAWDFQSMQCFYFGTYNYNTDTY